MGKHAVVVIGPAGAGKSTCCKALAEHYAALRRSVHVVNLDPAAEELPYEPSVDIRGLIGVDDAMETQGLGPNGGLVFCMEYLMAQPAWLHEQLGDYADDFIIVDMPGQIELMAHVPVVPDLAALLQREGYFVTTVFLLDAVTATGDAAKFVSGCLLALTAMTALDCPFIGVLSKCDMLPENMRPGTVGIEHYERCDFDFLQLERLAPSLQGLTRRVAELVQDFSLVKFMALDLTNEDCVADVVQALDQTLQVDDEKDIEDGEGGGEEGDGDAAALAGMLM